MRHEPTRVRRVVLLLAVAACGFAFGFAISSIPTPESDRRVLGQQPRGFVARFGVPCRLAAAQLRVGSGGGVCADLACVVGFYLQSSGFVRLGVQPTSGFYASKLPPGAPFSQRVVDPFMDWLSLMAPWLAVALVFGTAFGLLGARWGASRWFVAGVLLALAFILEPVGWLVVHGSVWPPYALWLIEVCLGVALLVWVVRLRRRRTGALVVHPAAGGSRGAAQQAHEADAQ